MTPVSFPGGGGKAAMTIIAALPRFASGLFTRVGIWHVLTGGAA